jgi:DUF1365 family protein
MNSCLYECSVMHHRFAPKVHHLQHSIFMFYLDLDELSEVSARILGFSHNRGNLYSFRDTDHEPAGSSPLKDRILDFLRQNGIEASPVSRVMLLTLPRIFGYIFNPISIYYCFDEANRPFCAVAEVGNTFREMKLYLLGKDALENNEPGQAATFRKIVPKHFYVSPFSSLTLNFDFQLKVPGRELCVKIDDRDGEEKILISTLAGRQVPLTNPALLGFTVKYPLLTLKVIFLIHYHALRLWLKGVPFHRKTENTAQQRQVLRPHSTLATPSK